MFLETERIILRKFREEDFQDFCAYAMDHSMSRMMGRAKMDTPEDARPTFDWLKDREERGYVLVLKDTGHVVGELTVTRVREELANMPGLLGHDGRSLNFSISRQYQRQGLMTEAVRAVISQLFSNEGIEYIQCGYFDFNTASRAIQERLGFTHLADKVLDIDGEDVHIVENILWRENWVDHPGCDK